MDKKINNSMFLKKRNQTKNCLHEIHVYKKKGKKTERKDMFLYIKQKSFRMENIRNNNISTKVKGEGERTTTGQ